mmetsp:Transcript_28119/g.24848  ORF Transcript_28119/g.24848 Transcript_28119/m.24848 type:complete len:134 (+) Transcript_28119:337-738(+)
MDLSMNKSTDYYEEDFNAANSKSVMIDNKLNKSKYLTTNRRLNETTVSYDRSVNRFQKKILVDKDRELDDKDKEIEEISQGYENKIRDLNKSRNDERNKYEEKLNGLGRSFKTLASKRKMKCSTTKRANTPIV